MTGNGRKIRVRWGGLIGLVVSAGALLSQPEILALLPEKVALICSAAGMVIQAVTKQPVKRVDEL